MSEDGAIRAVAEAWASIDGRLEKFEADEHVPLMAPGSTGHFLGYMCDAEELLKRVRKRGFTIVPLAEPLAGQEKAAPKDGSK